MCSFWQSVNYTRDKGARHGTQQEEGVVCGDLRPRVLQFFQICRSECWKGMGKAVRDANKQQSSPPTWLARPSKTKCKF